MMSMVGAERVPDTTAAPVLGDAWAPAGAAGFDWGESGPGLT
jgi:hypothetical protein